MYDGQFWSENDEVNAIIEKYVQEQMIRALDQIVELNSITEKWEKGLPLSIEEEDNLIERATDLEAFPTFFDPKQIPETLEELYTIISSEDRYIPNLIEEYVLAEALKHMADFTKDNSVIFDTMPQRNKVIEVLKQTYIEYGDAEKEAEKNANEQVCGWENYSDIVNTFFYDTDYSLLRNLTPEMILSGGFDAELGVGALEPARKRLDDGSLEFIGKPKTFDTITIKISR